MLEVGVVILRIQLKILAEEGDVEAQRSSHVPCLLLLKVRIDDYLSATCQQRNVLCQGMR